MGNEERHVEEALLRLIKKRYFSLTFFANEIGYSRSTMTNYIYGKKPIPTRAKRHISLELTGSPNWTKLFTKKDF